MHPTTYRPKILCARQRYRTQYPQRWIQFSDRTIRNSTRGSYCRESTAKDIWQRYGSLSGPARKGMAGKKIREKIRPGRRGKILTAGKRYRTAWPARKDMAGKDTRNTWKLLFGCLGSPLQSVQPSVRPPRKPKGSDDVFKREDDDSKYLAVIVSRKLIR